MTNVLLTMRVVENPSYPERRDAIAHDFPRYLESFGLRPLLVPNVSGDPEGYLEATAAKGLVLSGGNDPAFAGGGDGISEERDATELRLLKAALARGIPVFGVCRGMQIINHHFGGGVARLDRSHVARDHGIRFRTPIARKAADEALTVNSFHDLGVRLNDAAPGLQVFAVSDDGIVEGIERPSDSLVAVQWHPERSSPSAEFDANLMREWARKCAR